MTELTAQEVFEKQTMEFHLTVLTRLARMHHLLEDIQNRLHYLQDPNWKEQPSPSAPPLSVRKGPERSSRACE